MKLAITLELEDCVGDDGLRAALDYLRSSLLHRQDGVWTPKLVGRFQTVVGLGQYLDYETTTLKWTVADDE